MGLTNKANDKVIENDALVVLCLRNTEDRMTHHEFKVRAAARGFALSKGDCHNMLHRATGRVNTNGRVWWLTAAGQEYRLHVLGVMSALTFMLGRDAT